VTVLRLRRKREFSLFLPSRPRRRARLLAAVFITGMAGLAVYSRSNPSAAPTNEASPTVTHQTPEGQKHNGHNDKAIGNTADTEPIENRKSKVENPTPSVSAVSAILIDAVSGQVLYEKNADAPRPMASTTKIMTGLLFCEKVPDDAVICASKKASETRESSLHLKCNEKVSAHDLLRGIMLRSANDGCVAAAEHIAGSEAKFAQMMTARARQLGAWNTNFVNAHGLHHKNHYTTARDLALIARVAMQNPRFEEVVRTMRYNIKRSTKSKDTLLRNHSRFLGKFPGADGIKTGWTIPAGKCYVGSATYGGWRLISVVLKSKDYVSDTQAMMKYGYDNFKPYVLARPGDPAGDCNVRSGALAQVPAIVKRRVQVVAPKNAAPQIESRIVLPPVNAPVQLGQTIGTFEAVVNGEVACSSPIVANDATPAVQSIVGSVAQGGGGRFWIISGILAVSYVLARNSKRLRLRYAAIARNLRRSRKRLAPRL
jgi:serine-type D-Ala-D-Ala carboxypeptidase (penicillin-binding protein 5/6)